MGILEIEGLSYTYPDQTKALEDISLSIAPHQRVALLGANGSGKSTLIQHLNGLLLPQRGSITVKGIPVTKAHLPQIRKTVGIVFDHPDEQLFSTSVYEDVAFGPRNLGLTEAQVKERVERVLSLIAIEDLRDRPPYNLSLGQKKKVAIAGVLAMEPEIMVFDEPFSGLDPASLKGFMALLDQLHALGHTILIATHDVDLIYSWAESCIILQGGKILTQGPITLLEDSNLMETASLSIPTLVEIFADITPKPRTVPAAREQVASLVRKANQP